MARIGEDAKWLAEQVASPPMPYRDDLLAFAAYDALEALERGRHWVAATFLQKRLNLQPTPERLEALWLLLKKAFERPFSSPPLWLTLAPDNARAYLATAVYRVAQRIKRRREMEDDIWAKARGNEFVRPGGGWLVYIEDQPDDSLASPELNPAKLIELRMDDRNSILDELAENGTPVDQEIVEIIRSGNYDRADIRNMVGSARLQAFERKVQRHRK